MPMHPWLDPLVRLIDAGGPVLVVIAVVEIVAAIVVVVAEFLNPAFLLLSP